jgi:hypothetical protein
MALYIALGSYAGGTFTEVTDGGYSRQAVTLIQNPAGVFSAAAGVTFGPAVTGFQPSALAIFDAAAGGNLLLAWLLTAAQRAPVPTGMTFTLDDSALVFRLTDVTRSASPVGFVWPAAAPIGVASAAGDGATVYSGASLQYANGVFSAPTPAFQSGVVINGLGDSITAASSYSPNPLPDSRFAAWAQSTVYNLNDCVQAGGYCFYCATAGTSASSGTGPTPSSLTDGTVTWAQFVTIGTKTGSNGGFLGWAEAFSLGRLNFDMTQGYGGHVNALAKVIVVNGGRGYTSPTITLNQGARATATVVNGVITAVTVTNPGRGSSGFTVSVSDPTGSGAVLSPVQGGSGTFGVYGCKTADMVARLPDCLASSVDIFTVLGGTNDISAGVGYATIVANLQTCYETLMAAGRKVIAIPVLPRTGLTTAQYTTLLRVNRWIRNYALRVGGSNPLNTRNIVLCDVSGLFTDGATLTSVYPVGGSSNNDVSVTYDGLHPSMRGGMYLGYAVWQAAQAFLGPAPVSTPRNYTAFDGYDPVANPGGNYLEGYAWQASTAYAVGQQCSNNSNVYLCTAAGTSASSGGPSGTGTGITDGGATWNYVRNAGTSIFAGGTTGTLTATGGISYVGSLATGYTLMRSSGTASGTITAQVESPWSDGHTGTRQSLQFSLGSGSAIERWNLRLLFGTYASYGILASDLGSGLFFGEIELELSSFTKLSSVEWQAPFDSTIGSYSTAGGSYSTGAGAKVMGHTGDVLALPNNGKMLLRTAPIVLPKNLVNFNASLYISFDASGGAASATATVKVNRAAISRYGVI